jgi:DNA repair exonuclease SbcCD ATPase subunit
VPEVESIRSRAPEQPVPAGAVQQTRFDPAHEIHRAGDAQGAEGLAQLERQTMDEGVRVPTDEATGFSASLVQQFRAQAQQLAAHLQQRQRELDRREAELHADLARHDVAARSARLWFQERQHDLAAQQAELASASTQAHSQDVADHQRELESREEQLAAAEAALARGQAELAEARAQFDSERRQSLQKLTAERHELITECRRAKSQQQTQRQTLTAQFDALDRRNAELKLLRSEVLDLQRETLEMRAALEALWGQMSPHVQPMEFLQSLSILRAKLAEEFRAQSAEVSAQRIELESLAATIAARCDWLSAAGKQTA